MKRVLKICCDFWDNPSRDSRELSVCRELGMEAMVMAKGQPGDSFRKEEVAGFPVYCFSTRPLGTARFLNPLNRVLSLFIWGRKARKFHADIITGHDLSGLFVGYLSNLGNSHKAKLVYDSHEFEIGRAIKRNHFQIWGIMHLERFLMKRCAFSIMVNDSIADEVQRIHNLKKRPVVARNTPSYWELDPSETTRVRSAFLKELDLPEDTFLVMYHGNIVPGRGIETLLRAVAQTSGTAAVILGKASDSNYLASLRSLCETLNTSKRVLFHPAVPLCELRNYAGAADVGMDLGTVAYKSYYLSLPNKFFENIQSMTPLIVGDCPEMGKIIRKYNIGLLVDPEHIEDVSAAIRNLQTDKVFYASCKQNLKKAKEELCWEKEKGALKQAYAALM